MKLDYIQQSFTVKYDYSVFFIKDIFSKNNAVLKNIVDNKTDEKTAVKLFFVIDDGVISHHKDVVQKIYTYFSSETGVRVSDIQIVKGGESLKSDEASLINLLHKTEALGIDRHSYIIAIGGGAVLDTVGFVAAITHRGVRHIRIPTTVLSQNDSGIGVKNGVNFLRKKNFLGTFAPPVAVINDINFLTTLSDKHWCSGVSEAVKVALIKDASFFEWLECNAIAIANRNMGAMQYQIQKCAQLHLEHIRSGDPFEFGSSRPLDFGHWSAHKLEQLSDFEITHGEAVAMGIALDAAYSVVAGWLSDSDFNRIIIVLQQLGFKLTHPAMKIKDENSPLVSGLQEFREHLGGKLTVMMLAAIGKGKEVNNIDMLLLQAASQLLQKTILVHAN